MVHRINMSHHQQTIQASPGDIIELQLEENPTTGYSWSLEDISPAFSIEENNYQLYSGAGIGGGGIRKIVLKVEQAGGHIRLKNRQPWSGDVYQTFSLDVKAV